MYHFLLIAAAVSSGFENLDALEKRVLAVAPQASSIDKRLKLAQCPADAVIEQPRGGAVVIRCPAVGWRLRVPLDAPADTGENTEIIIRKGDIVECVAGGAGFSVSTTMIALEDARIGEPVRVKSPTSPQTVSAMAKARGLVTF